MNEIVEKKGVFMTLAPNSIGLTFPTEHEAQKGQTEIEEAYKNLEMLGPRGREELGYKDLIVSRSEMNVEIGTPYAQSIFPYTRTVVDVLEELGHPVQLHFFSWDKVPGDHNARFTKCLKHFFDIEWIKTAKTEKIDNRTIRVSKGKNFLLLRLNNEKNRASLIIDDGRTYEFIARTENRKLNIYYSISSREINMVKSQAIRDEEGE